MNGRVAILGCGKIGESLLAGLLSSGTTELVATARRAERAAELKERHGVETTLSNAAAVAGAGVVVLAVKPQDFEELLDSVRGAITKDQTVLSVAAAIPTAFIERRLGPEVPVVRAMPNAPATVHEGITGLCAGSHASEEHVAAAEEVSRASRRQSSASRSRTWTPSRPCPAPARPTSRSSRRR